MMDSDGADMNVTGLDQAGELMLWVIEAQQSCCGKYVVYTLYRYVYTVRVVVFGIFLSIKFIIQRLLIIQEILYTKSNNDPQNITVYQASI